MDNNNIDNSDGNKKPSSPKKKKFSFYWVYAIIIGILLGVNVFGGSSSSSHSSDFNIGQLYTMLENKQVARINLINDKEAEIYLNKDGLKQYFPKADPNSNGTTRRPNYSTRIGDLGRFEDNVQEAQKDNPNPIHINYESRHNWGMEVLSWVLPIALMIGLWVLIMRSMNRGGGAGGQVFNIGKSKATLFDKDNIPVSVTFKDVAGLEEAKVEIMEIVDFLKNPNKYTKLGGKIPKGVLLVGPPGTGKTLLAKSVAGEANVPFFSISGSDFVEMFVGVGASRVRDLFKNAKEKSPCIIFIDEIDAIGRARGKNPVNGGNDERESTLNQLLTEMDGFGTNSGVIVIAATNRADILDKALMRAGRFDRQIYIELPDIVGRKEIFDVHMKKLKLSDDVDRDFLAKQTPGFSGADIANVCNEAALMAARKDKNCIERQDFLDAIDRIIGGLEKKNKIITAEEKKVIAYHEAGHATTSWLLQYAHPLVKVTIVPRGKSLGAAWYLPEERQITTKEQLFHEMIATLGGRAAEQVIFGTISTGALSDLEKVTKQAYAMVTYYGLNEEIGNLSFYDSTGQHELSLTKPFSEKTAEKIDQEISKLVEQAYKKAIEILSENKEGLTQLAEKLVEKEVIFGEDLEVIFGKRPWSKDEDNSIVKTEDTITTDEEEQKA